MSRKKWVTRPVDKSKAAEIAGSFGIDIMSALILVARGIDTAEKVSAFFGRGAVLSDPFSLADMDKAVARISRAIDGFERICVYGDYDCDGLTATTVLYTYLDSNGADVVYYIPSRIDEGYGLNTEAIDKLKEIGVNLIVTVDNGISAVKEAEYIKELGMELVVTDHHTPGDELPEAEAVVDPHRADDFSAFKDFAGVGVAFKLICALEQSFEGDSDPEFLLSQFSDLVAIGTIADLVPLNGENRLLVKRGIRLLNREPRPGFEALKTLAGIEDDVTSDKIAYSFAPRINAAGRMGDAGSALLLLMTEDPVEAESLAAALNNYNDERHKAEGEIFDAVKKQIEADASLLNGRVLVFAGHGWHSGVMGIVAARIVETYGKPAIVISKGEDGIAHGSCRSIEGFSIYDAVASCSDILVHFGGHPLAAGLGLKNEDTDIFRKRINEYALTKERAFGTLNIDVKLLPRNINTDILESLSRLEPYGSGNPAPVFGLFKMTVQSVRAIGSGKHIRLELSRDGETVTAVKFGMTAEEFPFRTGDVADFTVKLGENVYRGVRGVSVQICEMRPSGTDDGELFGSLALYDDILAYSEIPAECAAICPDRKTVASVYTYIRSTGSFPYSTEILAYRTGIDCGKTGTVQVCLDALREMKLISGANGVYTVLPVSGKVDLGDAPVLKKLGYKG